MIYPTEHTVIPPKVSRIDHNSNSNGQNYSVYQPAFNNFVPNTSANEIPKDYQPIKQEMPLPGSLASPGGGGVEGSNYSPPIGKFYRSYKEKKSNSFIFTIIKTSHQPNGAIKLIFL